MHFEGCMNVEIDCDDGNPCTDDACDTGTGGCVHKAKSCDDGNSCTADSCDINTGNCVNTNDENACPPCTGCGCQKMNTTVF
jgi:hypothetical protein